MILSWKKNKTLSDDRHLCRLALVSGGLVTVGFLLWMLKPVGDLRLVFLGYTFVLSGSVLGGIRSGFAIDYRILLSFLASVFVGVIGAIVGAYNANEGVESEIVFFVLLPLAWLIFTLGIQTTVIRVIMNIMPFAGLFIGGIGVLYWMHASGRADMPWVNFIDLGQGLGSEEFGYEMRYYPISTLVFMMPFLIMSTVVNTTYTWAASRIMAVPAVLATMGLLFVAGRRALFVSLAFSLVAVYFLFMFRRSATHLRSRMFIVLTIAGVAATTISFVTGFSLPQLVESVLSSDSTNDTVRNESAANLLDSWAQNPVFGNGLGATIPGPPRNLENPWEFEVQYHLILNALGLFGFIVLACTSIELLVRATLTIGSRLSTHGHLIPIVAGTISVLLANATNPYLHTPGHYWMFFLLVLAVNDIFRSPNNYAPSDQDMRHATGSGITQEHT